MNDVINNATTDGEKSRSSHFLERDTYYKKRHSQKESETMKLLNWGVIYRTPQPLLV
jgi:hypothetical protein